MIGEQSKWVGENDTRRIAKHRRKEGEKIVADSRKLRTREYLVAVFYELASGVKIAVSHSGFALYEDVFGIWQGLCRNEKRTNGCVTSDNKWGILSVFGSYGIKVVHEISGQQILDRDFRFYSTICSCIYQQIGVD